jgi:hypothetical protein
MPSSGKRNASSPLVVRTAELAAVLQRWVDEWRIEHPAEPMRSASGSNFEGELNTWFGAYLSDHKSESMPNSGALSKLSQGLSLDQRVFTRILRCESATTNYELADEILQFIERPDAIHTGEIRVIPNPRWSNERWQAWSRENGAC